MRDRTVFGLIVAALIALLLGLGWHEYEYPCVRSHTETQCNTTYIPDQSSGYLMVQCAPTEICDERTTRDHERGTGR